MVLFVEDEVLQFCEFVVTVYDGVAVSEKSSRHALVRTRVQPPISVSTRCGCRTCQSVSSGPIGCYTCKLIGLLDGP